MKNKEKRRSSHVRMRKLFSFGKSYRSVERDDESRADEEGGLLQESSAQPLVVLPPMYSTEPSGSENKELVDKEGDECPSTPDSFMDLIDGRKFDFASVPIEENDPFITTETAPIVAGGSNNTTSDGPARQAQMKNNKKKHNSLCEWPEDKLDEELVEEAWQGPSPKAVVVETTPPKAPTPECIVSGTIELKTKDQPSGITFQKTDHMSPLKIQAFSPFSQFKKKTDLEPGMVVIEINGREMTWASAKEAVVEIKRAKPGKVTIKAIAPSKIESAPKALVEKISTPRNTIEKVKKEEKQESVTKPKGKEPKGIKNTWPPKQAKSEGDGVKSPPKLETIDMSSKPSKPTHYRDPTLTMMDSIGTEKTEDTTDEVKTPDGPTFKELNPSVATVESSVTVDEPGVSSKQVSEEVPSPPLESKIPKKTSETILGHVHNDVEMDVVYVLSEDDFPEEEDEIEPETSPQPTTFYKPKQPNKATVNLDAPKIMKPPLPPKRAVSAPSATRTRPPSIRIDEPASSAEEIQADSEDEGSQGGIFLCDAIDVHIAPMLQTIKDFSYYANGITERMPSWMRVVCHE